PFSASFSRATSLARGTCNGNTRVAASKQPGRFAAVHNGQSMHCTSKSLTVEMFPAHILTQSKNDHGDGNVGAAEKPAADARGHSGASAAVGWHVSAAAGESRAPVGSEPVAHPVRPEGGGADRGNAASGALLRRPDSAGVAR